MKKLGSELIFISKINQDGSGISPIPDGFLKNPLILGDVYKLRPLSMTYKTFIAFRVGVYIVKIKESTKPKTVKYIAFEGTYNEQIFDSETKTIIWTNKSDLKVENVGIQLETGTWKELPE
jgi:hypothetical protein